MDLQKTAAEKLTGIEGRLQDDGERTEVCRFDGWPTALRCECGHGHGRHTGENGVSHCMSYVGQPDCGCTGFRPHKPDVAWVYRDAEGMAAALRTIAESHVRRSTGALGCRECGKIWPCDTYLAIEGMP